MSAGQGLPGVLAAGLAARQSRALFSWEAGGLSLAPLTGQAPTFARATVGGAVRDAAGLLRQPIHSAECWDMVDLDGDGIPETPGLIIDPQSTNLCLQSENFGTTWAPSGSPTRTAAALRCGALVLDLLGDDSAAALEAYLQTVGFTGNAVKAVSLFIAQGSSASTLFQLRDTTAAANRLFAVVTWNADGSPAVAMTTGTHLFTDLWAILPNGKRVYRLGFQTTSVIAANTNSMQVYPATVAGEVGPTGDVYVGGVQCENQEYPTTYVKTTTATVTRNLDALSYPFAPLPQALTLYVRFVERTADNVNVRRLLQIGTTSPRLTLVKATGLSPGTYTFTHTNSSGVSSSAAPSGVVVGSVVELAAQLYGDGSVQLHARRDGGAITSAARSATLALASAWDAALLTVGNASPATGMGATLLDAKVAAGIRTLDQMAQLL